MMKKVFIAQRANRILIEYLEKLGSDITIVPRSPLVYPQISDHPDIFMCRFDDGEIMFANDDDLGFSYPENIGFNAVCLKKYFIHNLRFTNQRLKQRVIDKNLTLINVLQGYTKCNTCIVDSSSVISSDPSIIKSLKQYNDIDVLEITPGHILLDGFDYGFLGGASGKIDDEIIFNGDLSKHPDFKRIEAFIEKKGCRVKFFTGYPLTDIGSIICK